MNFRTGADTNTFTNANRVISLNRWYHKVTVMILNAMDEWDYDDTNKTDFPIMTANVVASQQDYRLPTGNLKLKRVEINYNNSNWYKAEPFDINERGKATDSTSLTSDYQTTKPYYDVQNGSIFLYPVPTVNVTSGLKIWINRGVTEFSSSDLTTGTASPGFDTPFHILIALGMAFDFSSAKGLQIAAVLAQEIQDYASLLGLHYGSKETDRHLSFQSLYETYD